MPRIDRDRSIPPRNNWAHNCGFWGLGAHASARPAEREDHHKEEAPLINAHELSSDPSIAMTVGVQAPKARSASAGGAQCQTAWGAHSGGSNPGGGRKASRGAASSKGSMAVVENPSRPAGRLGAESTP